MTYWSRFGTLGNERHWPSLDKRGSRFEFCMRLAPGVGWVAQLVEQRTENPCVGGSIPSSATSFQVGTPRGRASTHDTLLCLDCLRRNRLAPGGLLSSNGEGTQRTPN